MRIVIANVGIILTLGDNICESTFVVLMHPFLLLFPKVRVPLPVGENPIILVSVGGRVPTSDMRVEDGYIISSGPGL